MTAFKLIITGMALLAAPYLNAAVFHVDGDFQGDASTGSSWLDAFPSVQDAIDTASASGGGEIWVKAGIYRPAGTDRTHSFALKPDIQLYGGFRGDETERDARNPKAYRTVLSGDIGQIGSADDNCYHVLRGASNCRIDGFWITGGKADGNEVDALGGGLLLDKAQNFTAANCTFEKNHAEVGGAIRLHTASAAFNNCTFYANSADTGGAIMTQNRTTLWIEDSIFSSNFSKENGGAAMVEGSTDTRFVNTVFLYNSTEAHGGAVCVWAQNNDRSKIGFSNCTFNENSARESGAAIQFHHSSAQLSECAFNRNFSAKGAGAIGAKNASTIRTSACTFSKNRGAPGMAETAFDETSSLSDGPVDMAHFTSMPKTGFQKPVKAAPAAPRAKPAQARPKPQTQMPDVFVLNASGNKVKLRNIVAAAEYTAVVFGDLTDPYFIKATRQIEASGLSYKDNGVNFFYIYRHLAYPENHGYVQPINDLERLRHATLAAKHLNTRIPWLADPIDNQVAKGLKVRSGRAIMIYNQNGFEEYAGSISDIKPLNAALEKRVGAPAVSVQPEQLPEPNIAPVSMPQAKLVDRIEINPKRNRYITLLATPVDSDAPHYVKARFEGTEELVKTGNGKIYIGFHIDPIYQVTWNNLETPLKYSIKTTPGSTVAPSVNVAPRITQAATDSEPREFLLEARKLSTTEPFKLAVAYSVRSKTSKRNISVVQQYLVYLKHDPFGGNTPNRQTELKGFNTSSKDSATRARFNQFLKIMDLDRNGRISRDEASGVIRFNFHQLDTNRNGYVERSEYEAYKRQQ
ncbi:hypothetical protein [Pontiella sulfatireligans]|uniref:Probable pectate lyase C n=1 Tax=Pontiella sulfatireligans TaxID=2750658 RepID=A0A6C2USP4_9BACT|nr:hypothetical protein [Pontiella sulfatireligans]VGO22973.1 hypothetical protein SCARR_05072 [Pontiella sulfatireligans]